MSRYKRLGWSLLVGGLAFTLGATTASAQGQARGHDKQAAREHDRDHDKVVVVRHDDHAEKKVVVVHHDDRPQKKVVVVHHDAPKPVVVVRRDEPVRDPRLRHEEPKHVVVVRHDDHAHHVPPGQAKRHYTPVQAVDVTRDVMHRHGYEVARVERHGDDQVVYYYRGNMGRGRGHGPLERMVIHPDHERLVVRQAPPSPVWSELRAALGL